MRWGGFTYALREHLSSELPTASTSSAALSIHDDIAYVCKGWEFKFVNHAPKIVFLYIFQILKLTFWNNILKNIRFAIAPPYTSLRCRIMGILVPGNRHGRIKNWQELLIANSDPSKWIYTQAPEGLTRLKTLRDKNRWACCGYRRLCHSWRNC